MRWDATSHRYNLLPLLRFHPGGVQRELVVRRPPGGKDKMLFGKKQIYPVYRVCGNRLLEQTVYHF